MGNAMCSPHSTLGTDDPSPAAPPASDAPPAESGEAVPTERALGELGGFDVDEGGEIHIIICIPDYKDENPLPSSRNGENMNKLATGSGASIYELLGKKCTAANVIKMIKDVGGRCGPDDYFIFYYAGHGSLMPDANGVVGEQTGNALALVDAEGCPKRSAWMKDKDFSRAIIDATTSDVNVIIISDYCHIIDDNKSMWAGRKLASFSASAELSSLTFEFSQTLMLSIDRLQDLKLSSPNHKMSVSVTQLTREIMEVDQQLFAKFQNSDIKIFRVQAEVMFWPLVPATEYVAPVRETFGKRALFPRSYEVQ